MAQGESNRWSGVTLESLLLHDGLQRVIDLVELPDDVQQGSRDHSVEIISFDSNNPQELAEQLKSFCGKRNLAYGQLLQYRLNAIVGLWRSQLSESKEEPVSYSERDRDTDNERTGSETIPFTSRVSLLLVIPILEHESTTRPELRIRTSKLLLDCLTDYPPLALIREPKDCFSELETLLCDWLCKERVSGAGQEEIETTAACLVALACARGTVRVFVRTIHVLESYLDHMKQLRVRPIMQRLTEYDSNPSGALCLLPSNHIVCWAFDDRLKPKKATSEWDRGRAIACDGQFLYVTGTKGAGLVKLGTGLHGTIRGYQYGIGNESNAGWLVWANGYLLHRPVATDTSTTLLANIIDRATLKTVGTVNLSEGDQFLSGSRTTLSLCSDGQYVFWVWYGSQPVTTTGTSGDKTRVLPIHIQPFQLKVFLNIVNS
jgi:E3 ubiquitin-protein ligase HECTD4